MELSELVAYLDEYLGVARIPDGAGALNGLQVAGSRPVRRLAVAVDASLAAIQAAVEGDADLLLVHHGLFWDGNQPLTGRRYARVKALLDSGMALYSSHLPLDVHKEVGNNAVLARRLGMEVEGWFGDYKGTPVGVWGVLELRREALAARLAEVLGVDVRLIAGGPERLRKVGVISGGGGDMLGAAREIGLDAFVTGEGAHHHFFDAQEGGINLYLGGHYATEVWGVRALASHLESRFGTEWMFIDQPTGL